MESHKKATRQKIKKPAILAAIMLAAALALVMVTDYLPVNAIWDRAMTLIAGICMGGVACMIAVIAHADAFKEDKENGESSNH